MGAGTLGWHKNDKYSMVSVFWNTQGLVAK